MNLLHVALLLLLAILMGLVLAGRATAAANLARRSVLIIVSCLILSPFVWLVFATFKDPSVLNEYVFLPPFAEWSSDTINLSNLRTLLAPQETVHGTYSFFLYIFNSVFLATAQTLLQVTFCSMAGFAFAVYSFRGRQALFLLVLGSMMIPPILLLAPVYRMVVNFGWMDTYFALLVPGAVGAYGIFLYRQAMMRVPKELFDAARIDGASELRIWYEIALPLVRPITGAFCLVVFLNAWNSFIAPNVFLQSTHKMPLPVILQHFVGQYENQYGVFLAGTFLAILPPACLFFYLQREFILGLTSGGVKE